MSESVPSFMGMVTRRWQRSIQDRSEAVAFAAEEESDAAGAGGLAEGFGIFVEHGCEEVDRPVAAEALEVGDEIETADEGQPEAGAHGDADGQAVERIDAARADENGIGAEGGGDADERAHVLQTAGIGQDHEGAIAIGRGHDFVEREARLASGDGHDTGVELEADDLLDHGIGDEIDGQVGAEFEEAAHLLELALGDEDRINGEVAGEHALHDEVALDDEAIALRGELAILEIAVERQAAVIQIINAGEVHRGGSIPRFVAHALIPTIAPMEHLEGQQSIIAAMQARQRRIDVILLAHGGHEEKYADVTTLAGELGIPIRQVDRKELDRMAHGSSHGGVIAVCSPKPRLSIEELSEVLKPLTVPPLLLLIEGVEDARNLGFVLRTAEAMGVHAVLIKKHLWDLDPVEIARPSSGAFERIPLVQVSDVKPIKRLQFEGFQLIGCLAAAKRTMYDIDMRRPTILALGGEKRGLSGAIREMCNRFVTIPTVGGASSLSLSHAAAIVTAEALRQRSGKATAAPAAEVTPAPEPEPLD